MGCTLCSVLVIDDTDKPEVFEPKLISWCSDAFLPHGSVEPCKDSISSMRISEIFSTPVVMPIRSRRWTTSNATSTSVLFISHVFILHRYLHSNEETRTHIYIHCIYVMWICIASIYASLKNHHLIPGHILGVMQGVIPIVDWFAECLIFFCCFPRLAKLFVCFMWFEVFFVYVKKGQWRVRGQLTERFVAIIWTRSCDLSVYSVCLAGSFACCWFATCGPTKQW